MTYELREYQKECIKQVLSKYKEINSQLVQLPTGSGKTVILWHILQALGLRSLIIAPTRELIDQIEETGGNVVDSDSIFCKRTSYVPNLDKIDHVVMTYQGAFWLLKQDKIDLYDPEIVIIDEAHRSRSKSTEKLLNHFKDKGVKFLGLTATPERLDGRSLLRIYDELTYSVSLVDLINQGYLVDLECYRIKTKYKLKDIKYSGGDFSPSVLRQLDLDSRNQIVLDVFRDKCPTKKTLIFCLSISHAMKMANLFKDNDIAAEVIYGSQSKQTRKSTLRKFRNGDIQVLCNCQLLTEGFDEPSIESLIIAKPTKSKVLYCQMVGRGVRPYKNKESCLVFDISDKIHNICSFDVVADMEGAGESYWGNGEKLTDVRKKYDLSLQDVDLSFEKFDIYEKKNLHFILALEHQKVLLKKDNTYFHEDITMSEAAYLIFKNKLLEKNGIDKKAYWEKWRHIPCPNKNKG